MDFEQLGRKELQALAKQYQIKANQSNAALVEALKNAIVNDYETSMIEDDDELMLEEDTKMVHAELVKEAEAVQAPVIVEKEKEILVEAPIATATVAIEEQLVPNVEQQPTKVSGKKRKADQAVECSGPFSVENVVVETNSPLFKRNAAKEQPAVPAKFVLDKKLTFSNDVLKVGDKVQALVDAAWVLAVIKRVNKASFRVQFSSGEEATVKTADIRFPEEEEEEEEVEEQPQEEVQAEEIAAEETTEPVTEEQEHIFDAIPSILENTLDDSLILDQSIAMDEDSVSPVKPDAPVAAAASVNFALQSPLPRKRSFTAANNNNNTSASRHSIAAIMSSSTPTTANKRKSTALSVSASARKSLSVTTPSRASISAPLPWNSSTKPIFHIGHNNDADKQTTTKTGKTPISEKKVRKAATPSRAKSMGGSIMSVSQKPATAVAPATASQSQTQTQHALMPKMNAAQRMRIEAMRKKMEIEKSIQAAVNTAHQTAFTLAATTTTATANSVQPPLKKARTTLAPTPLAHSTTAITAKSTDRAHIKTSASASASASASGVKSSAALPHVASVKPKIASSFAAVLDDEAKKPQSTASVRPKTTATTVSSTTTAAAAAAVPPVVRKTTTPNFDRMHQKTFEKQKALTSCVSRDIKINKNMDTAFSKAVEVANPFAETVSASITNMNTTTAIVAATAENNPAVSNTADMTTTTTKASKAFVTKRKAHVAFETSDKESDHFGSLLDLPTSAPADQQPVAKKLKIVDVSSSRKSVVSVAEKTTAAAVASKKAVMSRKSEVAPSTLKAANPSINNHRKSIRL